MDSGTSSVTSWVAVGRLLKNSLNLITQMWNGDDSTTYPVTLLRGVNEFSHVLENKNSTSKYKDLIGFIE